MILSEAKTATQPPFLGGFIKEDANSVRAHHSALMNNQNSQKQRRHGARIHVQACVGGVLIETV